MGTLLKLAFAQLRRAPNRIQPAALGAPDVRRHAHFKEGRKRAPTIYLRAQFTAA